MKTLILYQTMMRQTVINLKRYVFETISGTLTLFLFFLAMFYGLKAMAAGPRLNNTLEGLVVGYAMWSLAIFAFFSMAQDLIQEAQLGTLEQIAMSPLGLSRVLMGRALSGLIWQILTLAVLLTLIMASTGQWLHINLLSILPIVILTVAGVVGFGFAMGGLAIVFKRVQSALQITQMGFIACLALPLSRFPLMRFAPLSWGNRLLTRVMVEDQSLFAMPASDVMFLVGHAAGYLVVGLTIFKYFEAVARKRGLLGHY